MFDAPHNREAVLKHQFVVDRLHTALVTGLPVVKRSVLGERFAGGIIVVDHDDVVVGFPAAAIGVGHDEGVGVRVHPLRKQIPKVIDALHVTRVLRIEFLITKRLPVMQSLDFTAGVLGQCAGPSGECTRRTGHVAGDRHTSAVVLAPDVMFSVGCAVAWTVVRGAHSALRSPNCSRT